MPSERILEQKKEMTRQLKEKMQKAKSIILVDYRGLNVADVNELRNKLKAENIEYKVIKNSIIMFAIKDGDFKELEPYLNGPTAIALSYNDEVSASKVLIEYSKKNENLKIKVGVVDGKVLNVDEIKALADIPSKDVLLSKILGSLNAPIYGLVNVLNANIRGLVVALNQIAQKKS